MVNDSDQASQGKRQGSGVPAKSGTVSRPSHTVRLCTVLSLITAAASRPGRVVTSMQLQPKLPDCPVFAERQQPPSVLPAHFEPALEQKSERNSQHGSDFFIEKLWHLPGCCWLLRSDRPPAKPPDEMRGPTLLAGRLNLGTTARVHARAGKQTIRPTSLSQRRFGAYAPLCRHLTPTDARINKGLGTEIADQYALLRDSYGE